MAKFFVVVVRWVETPIHPPLVDGILGIHGDWLRFTSDTWFVFSNENAKQVSDHIQSALRPNDSVMAFEVVTPMSWGFAPPWVWEWFSARTHVNAAPGSVEQPSYYLPQPPVQPPAQ